MRVHTAFLIAAIAARQCNATQTGTSTSSTTLRTSAAPFGATFVSSRTVLVSLSVSASADVECVECWVTRDDGDSWSPIECIGLPPSPVSITVDQDGPFGFVFILENEAGRSEAPPLPGDPPAIRMIVDTAPPTVQFRDARFTRNDGIDEARVSIEFSVIDENLGGRRARLFFRRAKSEDAAEEPHPWTDAGLIESASPAAWTPPADVGDALDLRIVATDQAGNLAFDEISGVRIATKSARSEHGSHVEPVMHAAHTTVEPAPPVSIRKRTNEVQSDGKNAGSTSRGDARNLLDAADRHMAASEFELAAARIEDYLARAGPDAEALSRLGRALYRSGRTDDAAGRFEAALKLRPDLADALEGSALAEATRGRYAQARERLAQLLRVTPTAGDAWLHLGDVENRLGNLDDALAAWRRAAEHAGSDEKIAEHARKRLRFFGPTSRPARSMP